MRTTWIAAITSLLFVFGLVASTNAQARTAPTLRSDTTAVSHSKARMPIRLRAFSYAYAHRGDWYCWGGTGGCFDCSGLVYASYRSAGLPFGRDTYDMLGSGKLQRISSHQAVKGDLVFWGDYHVEFFDTWGWTFGAQQSGTRVGFHRIWGNPTYWRVKGAG